MTSYVTFDALGEYPYFVVAICPNENDNWFVAGQSLRAARGAFEIGRQQFPKPHYRVVAAFNAERLKKDLALAAMPVMGTA